MLTSCLLVRICSHHNGISYRSFFFVVRNVGHSKHIDGLAKCSFHSGPTENAQGSMQQVLKEGQDAPSPKGFVSLVSSTTFGKKKREFTSRYTFEAPGIIRIRSEEKKEGEMVFGAALHCIPLGKGRSRLLFKVNRSGGTARSEHETER